MPLAHIALGANLGDRLASLRAAVRDVEALGRVTRRSSVWETEALGPPPDYYNAVVALETALAPTRLLEALLAIEARHGRRRDTGEDRGRNLPRTLDLDLLLYDDRALADDRLEIPHPRLHERAFVLAPLCEISPRLRHPVLRRSMRELFDALPRGQRVRRLADPL